ncbi:MAG: choice-of-anchor D domain-containing protein, partial [bacterium]
MRSKVLFLAVVLVAFIAVAGSQAQQAVLSVRGGSGTPGSVGNLVQIDLDNTEVGDIYALQFDLGYDSKVLSIANISRTVRTDSSSIYDVFEWRVMTGGIVRFAIVKIEPGIMAGTGSIADIFFDVDDEAVPGEYPLVLSNVILADCSGIEVSVTTSDGIFIISGGTGLRVVGTSGSPGSEGNEVSIRLYNEKALSELSFTLNFDSAGLSLRNVLPTDRTQQLDHFDWSLPDPGRARLSIQGSEGQTIPFGSGAIASFLFSVATQVYSGQYLLTLSEVSARDSVGETVNVISSDGTFTVYGGIEPDIDLSESRHDFYEVLVGDTASWDLTIYNRGRSDLDVVTITSSSAEFRPLGQQFHRIIPPGDSLDVTVTFTPTDEGQKEGALTIYCNDPDEPEQSVSLKGTGILEGKVLLSVEDKAGYPGHKDLPVPVKLDNTVRIRECSFALNYDTTSIAFTYVGWMERVASMPRRCSEPSPGKVEVFLSDTTDRMIQPGSGPILYICFDILGRALPGVTPVTLSDILFLRADGDTLDVDTEDGEVRVLEAQPDIVVPDTSHNFGYCLVGDTVRWDLAFYNKGHGNLTVDSVVTDDSCFAIERASFPQNIFSGESLPVTVIFTPQAEGSVSTLLFVFSNDPDEEQVILTLYGHGLFELPALLTLSEGAGLPGDSGAVVALHLSNSIDIALVELDLLFDTASLVVLDVQRTPRTSSLVLEIFDWASTEDGIRIAISGTDRFIPTGAGVIAELVFKVASDTAPNQYPLRLENIIVSDPSGFELPWRAEDGSFTVAAQAALRIGNSSGAPGSADNVVPIELMNERALSRLQFTVHYPDSVMRWSKIVATGRLLNGTVIHTDYQEGMLSLNIESPEGGTIPAGSGRILELWFHVGINAASGLYALHLSGATASDSVGVPVEVSLLHGNFTVGFGDIDLSAYEHDFGEVSLGDTAFWSFTMFNRGWIDLKVFDIVSSDPNFIVILPLFPETVLAGSQLPVVVAFAPTELGSSAGTLAVLSDDPDEETLFVRLSGSAKEPHIELSVNEIDFGDVEVCASVRRMFTISNVGVGDLIVTSLSSDNPAFRVTSPSFPQSIAAGSEIDVVVVFSPDRLDMYSGTIEISSDDPDEPLILLPVTGRGVFGEPSLRVGKTYGMFSDTNWVSVSLKNDRPVSQVHFSVNYDDNCLIPLDVVPTSRTAPLSHLSFQELEPGRLSVHLADDGGRLIGQGSGEILNLGFEWRPGECDSNLRVNLSDVSVLDDLNQEIDIASEDGKFFVVPFEDNRLFVGDASFDGVMPLILSNVTSVAALQADLLFDTTILRVKEVKKTPRSLYFGIFSWSSIDRGIRVAMTSEHYFGPGVGSIADMTFERLQTPPSCSVPVIVSNVVLADPLGTEIPVTMGQGTFVASGEARLKAGDGSGFPGDAERAITIFLSNTLDAASIEFDLGYDSDVLQVTQTLPTSRTGHMGLFQW